MNEFNENVSQINMNSSSIIDLKAELYRKKEDFHLKKLSQTQQQFVNNDNNLYLINSNVDNKYKLGKRIREKAAKSGLKFNDKNKSDINLEEINDKLNEEKLEEEKALKKSREMLEKKSKLYEKMTNNIELCLNKDDEEIDDRILVNFEQKALQKQVKEKNDSMKKSENINDLNESESEEKWTEFVDSLGRSRKCLEKDLQHFKEMDRKTFQNYHSVNDNKSSTNSVSDLSNVSSVPHLSRNNELLSNDLNRELDRREWETMASMQMNRESDGQQSEESIHYQNIQFNEIRDHGVAYYSFSKDSHQREEQMDLLNNLRQQTKNQKIAKQKLKQKRKVLMRERLTKIAQRKGISIDFPQSSDSEEETEPEEPEEKPLKEKPISVREWDVGKEDLLLELPKSKSNTNSNNYFQQMRADRNPDFAPPLSYNKNQFRSNSNDNRNHFKSQRIPEKVVNINNKNDKLFDNIKSPSFSPPKPDVNQIITNGLSFFRNNSK